MEEEKAAEDAEEALEGQRKTEHDENPLSTSFASVVLTDIESEDEKDLMPAELDS